MFSGLRVLVIRPVVFISGPLLYESFTMKSPRGFLGKQIKEDYMSGLMSWVLGLSKVFCWQVPCIN